MHGVEQPKDRLCLALDVNSFREAEDLIREVKDCVGVFKIGMELFTSEGPNVINLVLKWGGKVFLDLKYHDIPNTVAGAARAATKLGVTLFDVHASGGSTMMKVAADAVREEASQLGSAAPKILGVTVLTSLSEDVLKKEISVSKSLADQVIQLAQLSQNNGMDGVVASPKEIGAIRGACGGSFIILTPGVRPKGEATDDQQRVTTPFEAVQQGADYIVVGRPILRAKDRLKAAEGILREITDALSQ